MSNLDQSLANLRARQEAALQKTVLQQLQLPLWSETQRGVPYTDEQIAASAADVKGKTEMDALVAYLQVMGRALK